MFAEFSNYFAESQLGENILTIGVLLVTGLAWQVIQFYTHYNTWLLWLAWKFRRANPTRPDLPLSEDLPHVTVQLPVYNENTVIARLLRSVEAMDYPRDRLDVQLLDDSTDNTPLIAAPIIAQLKENGLAIEHIRRNNRHGFKAGALREAMPKARGELILMLDADFVPAPDLIRALVPWFKDDKVAMAQARWGHLDQPKSIFARCSRYWIDRHFGIEQLARSRSGQFFHFNGSGGMWRRTAIDDAGGWLPDTLAEDLDLSFRAWSKQWRFIYDDETVAPAELPDTGRALRVQQARWARGAFQVARKSLPKLSAAPFRSRLTIGLHLSGYTFPILLLGLALLSGPAAWARLSHPWLGFFAVDLPVVGFIIGLGAQFLYRFHREGLRVAILEIESAALGLGLAPLVFKAGLTGLFRSGGTFHRTPKSQNARGGIDTSILVEVLLAMVAFSSAGIALVYGAWPHALLPTLAGSGLLTFALRTAWPGTAAISPKEVASS